MHRLFTGPLTVEQLTVTIQDLPPRLQGCRIAHLSDFHYDGTRLSPWLLEAAIQAANAAEPDLVVLTGDYVTQDVRPIFELARHLGQLTSRWGICACLGNHDNLSLGGRQTIITALKQVGITVLWNQIAYPLGDDFPVVGLADFWSQEFAPATVLAHLPTQVPRLVLSHNPDTAEYLQPWRVDLQLSGHTHGGQILLPGVGPLPALTQRLRLFPWGRLSRKLPGRGPSRFKIVRHWEWVSGLHRVQPNQLYVNRGLGTYEPGRFRCPPEVAIITLVVGHATPLA